MTARCPAPRPASRNSTPPPTCCAPASSPSRPPRPGIGKSPAALDFARATSIKHGMASVVFSLEMSRIEITMRLLSAEARVHLQNTRNRRMSEDDWARLARRMGEIASAPLFIDDSPSLNMMELRAKCRRLKQKHDLKLVVLDYLQLMNPP